MLSSIGTDYKRFRFETIDSRVIIIDRVLAPDKPAVSKKLLKQFAATRRLAVNNKLKIDQQYISMATKLDKTSMTEQAPAVGCDNG